jgi:SAM-dependent MidA family methyltransferase
MKKPLENLLRDRIKREGPVTYREFLELVLYHPDFGYYNQKREIIGKEGDFYTSSDLHPLFGWTIARLINKLWLEDRRPSSCCIVEPGAGKGYLAYDILKTLESEEIFREVSYLIIERSEAMIEREKEILGDYLDKVQWLDLEEEIDCSWVFMLSNELFDSFPFHRVVRRGSGFRELYIGLSSRGFEEIEGELSSKEIKEFLQIYLPYCAEGQILEVMPQLTVFLDRLLKLIPRGYFLTFDYGFLREELLTKYPRGTLKTYRRHQVGENPLIHMGDQDITAHVDFSLIEEGLRANGFEVIFNGYQGRFLIDSGITDVLDDYLKISDEMDAIKARLALKSLVYDFGSVFRVIFAKR